MNDIISRFDVPLTLYLCFFNIVYFWVKYFLGRYICRIWNGPGYLPEIDDVGQLIGFQLYFYQEPLKYVVGSVEGHDNILLWNHTCF